MADDSNDSNGNSDNSAKRADTVDKKESPKICKRLCTSQSPPEAIPSSSSPTAMSLTPPSVVRVIPQGLETPRSHDTHDPDTPQGRVTPQGRESISESVSIDEPSIVLSESERLQFVTSLPAPQKLHEGHIFELNNILWGRKGSDEIFSQWIQGLNFSEMEPTSLVQLKGGPCALIAPLQSFILRRLLFIENNERIPDNWRKIDTSRQDDLLISAIIDVITVINSESYCIVEITDYNMNIVSKDNFHNNILVTRLSDPTSLRVKLTTMLNSLHSDYGVLQLLYTYLLTKGLSKMKSEIEDPSDTFIDQRFGHGSQSLINLMLTGHAVANVFDGNKDCGGLVLMGIHKQSDIGFLTLLEHLRYCEVGWYYKNPVYPIWLIGSETHLTILFSTNCELITLDSPLAKARRVFDMYIMDNQGFVFNDKLGAIMNDLNLVSDPEYVNIITERLDPEKLGLITCDSFMKEFFASELETSTPSEYPVYHYNGVCNANIDNQVQYKEGIAKIEQLPEFQIITDTSTIKSCLLTKWPTIDLSWKHDNIPSLN